MQNYLTGTVIIPWDFSEMSLNALRSALEMVESPEKIEVVHVTMLPTAVEPGVVWGTVSPESIVANLNEAFEKSCKKNELPKLKFTAVFGDPGSEIAEIAESSNASLVVISSHGRTGLSRLFLGSVAERVIRFSPCPVLVLRGTD